MTAERVSRLRRGQGKVALPPSLHDELLYAKSSRGNGCGGRNRTPSPFSHRGQAGWTCRCPCSGREPTSTDVHRWEPRGEPQGGGKHGGERLEAHPTGYEG